MGTISSKNSSKSNLRKGESNIQDIQEEQKLLYDSSPRVKKSHERSLEQRFVKNIVMNLNRQAATIKEQEPQKIHIGN